MLIEQASICYWLTIHNIWGKKFNHKIFQLQSMLNAIRCIDQRFAFKNSGILRLALIFDLSNQRTTILHSKKWFQVARYNESYSTFFCWLLQNNGSAWQCLLLLKAASNEWVTWVRFQQGAILRGIESVSALTCELLYCCTLYNFFFLGFRQRWSSTDRVVNLNMTIQLQLFWRTWTWAWPALRPYVLAWHMGRDYSNCGA